LFSGSNEASGGFYFPEDVIPINQFLIPAAVGASGENVKQTLAALTYRLFVVAPPLGLQRLLSSSLEWQPPDQPMGFACYRYNAASEVMASTGESCYFKKN